MPRNPSLKRRSFLTGTAVAAAGLASEAKAQGKAPSSGASAAASPKAAGPSAAAMAAETRVPPELPPLTTQKTGSDFMIDVIKTLKIDYLTCVPGSTFRALHESVINYGNNTAPEFITCLHEEASIAMAQGYAKVAGKPLFVMVHGTVGLQHASMAIYNAYADRVPMLIVTGNADDANDRRPGIEWLHSVQDGAAQVRDYTKWDDSPGSLGAFADSTVRAYQLSTAVPMAPVLIVADTGLQERPLEEREARGLKIPKYVPLIPPEADGNAVRELAKALVAAQNPVLIVDRYARTANAMGLLVQFADLLNIPVVDQRGRVNFPNRHPLNHSTRGGALIAQADFILALEPTDLFGSLNNMSDVLIRQTKSRTKVNVKLARISSDSLLVRSNYQDFQRYSPVDFDLAGDAEATMPALIAAVQHELSDARKLQLTARGDKLRDLSKGFLDAAWQAAGYGWDASPISTARLDAEIWAQIKDDSWAMGSDLAGWANRLWNMDKPWHHNGSAGAGGVGQATPAAVGAALANRDAGRYTVAIVGDGDFNMVGPGALWTAAHHKIPVLIVIHNNRAYHQEYMHIQRMANRHNRGIDRNWIGTTIRDPNINYAKVAEGMGVRGIGPITDPRGLAPALKQALAIVKKGEPVLIDAVTQPR